jgi:hypothetical protein
MGNATFGRKNRNVVGGWSSVGIQNSKCKHGGVRCEGLNFAAAFTSLWAYVAFEF